jgi:hypothetical protein
MYNLLEVLEVNEMKSKLRKLRLIQFAMIAAIFFFGWVAEIVCCRGSNDWTSRHWLMTCLAACAAWAGFRFRHMLLHRAEQKLVIDASDPKALKLWEAVQVCGLAMAVSTALWGIVVRMVLNGAFWQASLFYAAGLVLLLLWTPRLPTQPASNSAAIGLPVLDLPAMKADGTAQEASWNQLSSRKRIAIGTGLAMGVVPFAGGAVVGVLWPTPALIVAVGLGLFLSERGVLFLLVRYAGLRAKFSTLYSLTTVISFVAAYGLALFAAASVFRGR